MVLFSLLDLLVLELVLETDHWVTLIIRMWLMYVLRTQAIYL